MHAILVNQTWFKVLFYLFLGCVIFSQKRSLFASQLLHLQNVLPLALRGCWGTEMGPACTVAVISIINMTHGHSHFGAAEVGHDKVAKKRHFRMISHIPFILNL